MNYAKSFALPEWGWGAVAVTVAVVAVYFVVKKAGGSIATGVGNVAKTVGTAINPADENNLVNRAVSGVGGALSGDQSWSLGSWLYDLSHEAYDPNKPVQRQAQKLNSASNLIDSIRGDDSITLQSGTVGRVS